MSKEAMKLALEALETYYGYMEPLLTVFGGPRVPAEQSTTWKVEQAITALREALAEQPAQQDSTCSNALRAQGKAYPRTCKKCGLGPCIELAQQALDKKAENARELGLDYEPAQQEPVALEAVYETIIHWDEGGGKRSRRELARRIVSLYHASPHCKPLTDEHIKDVLTKAVQAGQVTWLGYEKDKDGRYTIPSLSANIYQIARAIEAAHGIKGEA